MKVIPNETFLRHAESRGLRPDPRYNEPRTLNYQNGLKMCVPMPADANMRKRAIFAALDILDENEPIWLWRRGGTWLFSTRTDRNVRDTFGRSVRWMFNAANIPNDTTGTLKLDSIESDALYALIYMNSLAACSGRDDLFVVPDACDFVIWFDHDEQIIFEFSDAETQARITQRLADTLLRLKVPTGDD